MIGDNETNFPHKLLLTNRQVSNLLKAFPNYLSTDIKLSKSQLSKMIQAGGFLGRLLGPLLKTGLPLIKNVVKSLAKSVLIPLGLTAAASAADVGKHKKNLGVWEYDDTNNIKWWNASLLGNILTGRGINRAGKCRGINRVGEGVIRAGYGSRSSKMDF